MLSHIWGIFSFFFSFFFVPPLPPASRPISQPGGPYPSLEHATGEAFIGQEKCSVMMASGLGFKGRVWASRLGFGPPGWDMGLQAEIWAWRLRGGRV